MSVPSVSALVPLTLGYCWRIYFKVLEVLFLASVSHAFLPSKQACGIHKFRHFCIRQQYPPVWCTSDFRQSATRKKCNKTRSKNQCAVGWSYGSFWTESITAQRSVSRLGSDW